MTSALLSVCTGRKPNKGTPTSRPEKSVTDKNQNLSTQRRVEIKWVEVEETLRGTVYSS
jgi:hypothetical protein